MNNSLYTIKRFFSILFLDKDIENKGVGVEYEQKNASQDIPHDFIQDSSYIFTLPVEHTHVPEEPTVTIQPEEIGGIEYVETKTTADTETPPIYEKKADEPCFLEYSFPEDETDTPSDAETLISEDYSLSQPLIKDETETQVQPRSRKRDDFVSLKDVLLERGNFWEDHQQKKKDNIWESEVILPEDHIELHDAMVVGDVLPETIALNAPTDITSTGEAHTRDDSNETPLLLGLSSNHSETITLRQDSLRRHTLIVGQTGAGKSTLMERMILQDIEAGRGVGLIDPHGDLYDRLIRQIPKSRSNDVVLFDLADTEYPIGFNILENTHEQFPSLIASSIVGVFKKIFGYSWGPRLEYILRNATLTLLEKPNTTLLDLTMLLTDEDFRNTYLQSVNNPFLQKFWSTEFDTLSQVRQAEIVSPILNKVGQFLSVPLIRNIVSQPQSGFSPRWVMDNEKIFLANLSKGKIGEDVSDMFGSMLVSKFQLDVMSRATIEPKKRVPFRLYVDEFQNFATESFVDIFSEARKYGMELVIAHQYLGQVDKKLMEAILGNVGNIVVFHTSHEDARILAPNMSQAIDAPLLTEQQNFSFIVKTVEDGKRSIKQGELLPIDMSSSRSGLQQPQKLQTLVREKFAKKREFVEEKLGKKMI